MIGYDDYDELFINASFWFYKNGIESVGDFYIFLYLSWSRLKNIPLNLLYDYLTNVADVIG